VEVVDGDPGVLQRADDGRLRVARAVHDETVAVAGDTRDARHRPDRVDGGVVGTRGRHLERRPVADGLAEPLDRVFGDELAVPEDADAVADGVDLFEHVRREKDGGAALGLGPHDIAHLLRPGGVEPRGGLVEDEELRVAHERHRQGEPLAHSLRVVAGRAVGVATEPHAVEQGVRVVVGVLRLDRERDVFPPREPAVHREPVREDTGPPSDRDPRRRDVGAEHADRSRGRPDEV